MNTSELLLEYGRARLGIDGNAGFALLGPNLQEGECEFVSVPIEHATNRALQWAAKHALEKLRARLEMPGLMWYVEDDYWGGFTGPYCT